MKFVNVKIILIVIFLFPVHAYAYFDPGTGSLLFQAFVGSVAMVAVFWGRIKGSISSLFGRRQTEINQEDE